MSVLSDGIQPDAQNANDTILDAYDSQFIAVFIEMMRTYQIGIVRDGGRQMTIAALETLSGQSFGMNWPGWIEWYAQLI